MGFREYRHPPQPNRPRFTPPQWAILKACDELNGGASLFEIEERAWQIEDPPPKAKRPGPHGIHDHYSRTPEQLINRGLLARVVVGAHTRFRLTDEGWRLFGHEGPAPTDPEQTLF